jgi:hypothetical protein
MTGNTPPRNREPGRQIAWRLIRSRPSWKATGDDHARTAADACGHLYRELSRWVGPDGCHALFSRALAQTRAKHPALEQIQLHARKDPYVEGVAEAIIAHGEPATADSLEAMIANVVQVLGRLIGDDMAMKLIERSLTADGGSAPSSDKRQEA